MMYDTVAIPERGTTPLGVLLAKPRPPTPKVCCIVYSKRNHDGFRHRVTVAYSDLARGGMLNVPQLAPMVDGGFTLTNEIDDMYMLSAALARWNAAKRAKDKGRKKDVNVFVLSGDNMGWARGACGWCPRLKMTFDGPSYLKNVRFLRPANLKHANETDLNKDDNVLEELIKVRKLRIKPNQPVCASVWAGGSVGDSVNNQHSQTCMAMMAFAITLLLSCANAT